MLIWHYKGLKRIWLRAFLNRTFLFLRTDSDDFRLGVFRGLMVWNYVDRWCVLTYKNFHRLQSLNQTLTNFNSIDIFRLPQSLVGFKSYLEIIQFLRHFFYLLDLLNRFLVNHPETRFRCDIKIFWHLVCLFLHLYIGNIRHFYHLIYCFLRFTNPVVEKRIVTSLNTSFINDACVALSD